MPYIMSNGKAYGGNINLITKGIDFIEIKYEDWLKIEDRETNGVLYSITDLDQYISAKNVAYGDSNVESDLNGLHSYINKLPKHRTVGISSGESYSFNLREYSQYKLIMSTNKSLFSIAVWDNALNVTQLINGNDVTYAVDGTTISIINNETYGNYVAFH